FRRTVCPVGERDWRGGPSLRMTLGMTRASSSTRSCVRIFHHDLVVELPILPVDSIAKTMSSSSFDMWCPLGNRPSVATTCLQGWADCPQQGRESERRDDHRSANHHSWGGLATENRRAYPDARGDDRRA